MTDLPPLPFAIDAQGWCAGARRVESPNCDERPDGVPVSLVVLHSISLPPGEFGGPWIEQLFLNALDPSAHPYFVDVAPLRVSAHFLVRRDGELLQFVPTTRRAWHAGVSSWNGRSRCNDFSVGIELEGCNVLPFEDAQYRCVQALIEALAQRHPVAGVVGHSDIAPGRKVDPGVCFDWKRLPGVVRPD
ncbi:MAG TPA: 1,6-anhydro-N-acetylmuramyl-L-alanine amidase AmpD [Methyloversatilis sp.]